MNDDIIIRLLTFINIFCSLIIFYVILFIAKHTDLVRYAAAYPLLLIEAQLQRGVMRF